MTKQEQAKKQLCCATVWTGMFSHVCRKPAKFEFKGKPFCGQHHPPTRDERTANRNAKWQAQTVETCRVADEAAAKQAALELDAARWRYWRVYMPSTMSEHQLDSMADEGLRRVAMEARA